jgi:hypothetical protein
MNKVFVKEDITDWAEEAQRAEFAPQALADIVKEQQTGKGVTIQAIARMTIAARQLGQSPAEIMQPNKLLLQCGGAVDIVSRIAAEKREIELKNGKKVQVRSYVAPVRQDDGDEDGNGLRFDSDGVELPEEIAFVDVDTQAASDRALDYLLTRVPGYVYGRLAIIAANGGDVRKAADTLIDKVEEMVEGLS